MKKEYIKSVAVLGSICLVIAVVLAAVNYVTAPIIKENAAKAEQASLSEVLEGADEFEKAELPVNAPSTVTAVYRDKGGAGFAVALSTTSNYSGSPMTFTLGISTEGKIVGVAITNYAETKDFGTAYPQSYIGADSTLSGIDLVSGVTYSSTAFKNAVADAFNVLLLMGEIQEGEKTSQQMTLDLMADILPGALDTNNTPKVIELGASDAYSFGYKAVNGCGYVYCLGDEGEERILCLSATGGIKAYGLHGETEMTFTEEEYNTLLEISDFNTSRADNAAAEVIKNTAFEKISLPDQFGTVIGAYKTEQDSFLFVCAPFGYKEPITLAYLLDSDGKIIFMKNTSEFVQDSEHYSYYRLDESEYRTSFDGKDKNSFSDDITLISGATVTSNAVAGATHDAFRAFDSAKEAAN